MGYGDWKLGGNILTGSEALGTNNNKPVIIRTGNNKTLVIDTVGRIIPYVNGDSTQITIGKNAGNGTTYRSNIIIGNDAIPYGNMGYYNIIIGHGAAKNVSPMGDPVFNTIVGWEAAGGISDGGFNSYIGGRAGYFAGGATNVAIGYESFTPFNTSQVNYSNSIAIGYRSNVTGSNMARFGNSQTELIEGSVSWTTFSDQRYKFNIKPLSKGLEFIRKLKPVEYNLDIGKYNKAIGMKDSIRDYKEEKNIYDNRRIGFLAQEVKKASEAIQFEFSGIDEPEEKDGFYSLRYAEFVAPLVKATQEQQKLILDQGILIVNQDKKITLYQQLFKELLQRIEKLEKE